MKSIQLSLLLIVFFPCLSCAPSSRSNVVSITFWEKTAPPDPGLHPYTFDVNDLRLLERISDRPNPGHCDFTGWNEYYDVFYSDEEGSFMREGRFITVEGIFDVPLPFGGGLNISEVHLNFQDGSHEYASVVTSYLAMGDNANEDSVWNIADGNINTCTVMGNTAGQNNRLRVTVGFKSPLALKSLNPSLRSSERCLTYGSL